MTTADNIMDSIVRQIRADKGEMSLELAKEKMLESATIGANQNHLEIKSKEVRIVVTQLVQNSFSLVFASIFHDVKTIEIEFEGQEKIIELTIKWTKAELRVYKSDRMIFEQVGMPHRDPGGTIEIELRPQYNPESKSEQCIFDMGEIEFLDRERISLIVNPDFSLVFKLIDKNGKIFQIAHPKSDYWGPGRDSKVIVCWSRLVAKMRVYNGLDSNDFGEEKVIMEGCDLFYTPINPSLIIGTDLEKKNFAKMTVYGIKIFTKPAFC
jgi:hypothetical protein